jgi:hypothetical protein
MVDHAAHTAIDKTCNFDLLNECVTLLCKRAIISLKKRREHILQLHKHLLTELKLKCAECLNFLNRESLFEKVREIDVIAAIKDSIERLASKDYLINVERNLKKKYKEIFEPIPHVDLLPSEETALIHLKDTCKTITSSV